MTLKVRILGCGTSSGVPRIGNDWGACDPAEPRNRRTRASILIEGAGGQGEPTRILVDTGPDLREQLLAADIDRLDAVIWTHDHADHTHGIDDLRQLFHIAGTPIRAFARPFALDGIRARFDYAFQGRGYYPPIVEAEHLPDTLQIGPITVRVIDQPHGGITSAGLRFELDGRSISYGTDFNEMTDAMTSFYAGTDLWVVDALGLKPHPTHSHLAKTLAYIDLVRPRRALLTHMDKSMDYASLRASLPPHIEPAHDGLEVEP